MDHRLVVVCLSMSWHALLLGRKTMKNLNRVLKSNGITLPTKVHTVKAMVFPVVTYGCESCTIKKAEIWRIDLFALWYWERLENLFESKEIKLVNIKGKKVKWSRSVMSNSAAYHDPPSMGFSRQEHWSGLPFPSPEDLPNPMIEPGSPAL